MENVTIDREALAAYAHGIWSQWVSYVISTHEREKLGCAPFISDEDVKHWKYQISTPYAELSDEEKKGGRYQADKIIAILRRKQ